MMYGIQRNVYSMFNNYYYVLDEKDIVLTSDGLCNNCFDLVISKKYKDRITPSDVKEAIINDTSIQDNLSDGVDDND